MLRPALLAAAFATAFPAYADPELDALRADLEKTRAEYEARLAALEEGSTDPAPTRSFNPDISLILQGRYAHLDDLEHRAISGFLPAGHGHDTARGFSLDHTELVMSASVDPYFNGYFNVALADDEIEVEEAWVQTTSLGHGVSVKGGRFLSALGYQNGLHPHAWDFADSSLMYRVLFGDAWRDDGVQVKWVAPTALFVELGAEAGRGASFPASDRNVNGIGAYTLFGHVGGDVGASHSWRAGLSYLRAKADGRESELEDIFETPVETLFSGTSKTWVADVAWKWAPDGNARERHAKVVAEYFRRDEGGDLLCEDGACAGVEDRYRARQSGYYVQGVYQFVPRWRTGYRYDRLDPGTVDFGANAVFLPAADHAPRRHTAMIDYSPSEFSRLRLQHAKDESMAGVSENQWVVQYIHSLGSHGAHRF